MSNIILRACVVLAGGSTCCAQPGGGGGSLTFYPLPDPAFQLYAISDDASTWIARPPSSGGSGVPVWRPGESYGVMAAPVPVSAGPLPLPLSRAGEVMAVRVPWNVAAGQSSLVWRLETGAEPVFDELSIGAISRNGFYAAGYPAGCGVHPQACETVAVRSFADSTIALFAAPSSQESPVMWVSDDGQAFGGAGGSGAYRREHDGVIRVWPGVWGAKFSGDGTVAGGRTRPGQQTRPHLLVGSEWTLIDGINEGPNDFSYAQDVADGGCAVVGMTVRLTLAYEPPYRPWYWSPETDTILVADLLHQAGLDTGDYSIQNVFAISDDGRTMAGGAWRDVPFDWTFWTATLPQMCSADIGVAGGGPGRDWILDNNDFIAFIGHFFAANSVADRGSAGGVSGSDGEFDNNDFIVFIDQFFQGCGG